jgi:hypothetical protein
MPQGSKKARGPLDENDKRRLVLKLVTQLRCAECGRLYDPQDFALIHRRQDVWVLSTRCRHCDEPCHVVVFMDLEAEAEPEPVTDLTPGELKVADQWSPITADDVLDMHALLCEFEGDFEELLED